ncbi:MAG TPA: glycosyltransferase family A protein [Pirellulaceae bacterium]|mgnify:CR=1 FL=1|nr:glycosyltransferase family A protein [Pirellulaceae bacterium]HMO93440.1 glycosyltransferase family A protein [Pirellulaceae bacterium]HMP68452.1 glycosyltransferase family A protein [Pirellulaceae bacterium]
MLVPQFSIVIPAYNAEEHIARSIKSVIGQTFVDWELIIVNDGSIDETKAVVETFLIDGRIRYFDQKNQGVSSARNFGASCAIAPWLVFLDSDDEILSDCLDRFVESIKFTNADAVVASSSYSVLPDGTILRRMKCDQSLGFQVITGSWCMKRQAFNKLGGYDSQLKFGENFDLFIRFKMHSFTHTLVEQSRLQYHIAANRADKHKKNKVKDSIYILNKNKLFFQGNPKSKWNQYNNIAVLAPRIGQLMLSLEYFGKSIRMRPFYWKSYFRILRAFPDWLKFHMERLCESSYKASS